MMPTPTVYEVYFEGRKGALLLTAFDIRELERMITGLLSHDGAISFQENKEAGAVFFTYAGDHAGFYRIAV